MGNGESFNLIDSGCDQWSLDEIQIRNPAPVPINTPFGLKILVPKFSYGYISKIATLQHQKSKPRPSAYMASLDNLAICKNFDIRF